MDITTDNCIFLLGGLDLEMAEIKRILQSKNFIVIDKELAWGAKLSDYQGFFLVDKLNIGVELTEDITPPENYLRIDHHNQFAHLPTSIEQIAKLLNMALTPDQEKIALEDKMGILGLSVESDAQDFFERKKILYGITTEQINAATAVKNKTTNNAQCNPIKKGDYPDFLIADQYYLENWNDKTNIKDLVIYNNTELCYYGTRRDYLLEKLEVLVRKKQIYFGGTAERGYIGANEKFPKSDIEALKDKISDLINYEVVSEHVFAFTFNWNFNGTKNATSTEGAVPAPDETSDFNSTTNATSTFTDRTNLNKDFHQSITATGLWKEYDRSIEIADDFNTQSYFYDFTQGKDLQSGKDYIKHYYFTKTNLSYEFKMNYKKDSQVETKTYDLPITKIDLKVYDSGVGVLRIFLSNHAYKEEDDVLRINNYGRRLCPQYVDAGFSLASIQEKFLPQFIEIKGLSDSKEDFLYSTQLKL